MTAFSDFLTWVFRELPDFLIAPPIIYFVALLYFVAVIALLKRIINITR